NFPQRSRPSNILQKKNATSSFIHAITPTQPPSPISLLAVPQPARRPVKGELCSATKRRTLDGPQAKREGDCDERPQLQRRSQARSRVSLSLASAPIQAN